MILKKLNRRKRMVLYKKDVQGQKKMAVVIMYDDLSKAKKPPAWMKELLYSKDSSARKVG